MYYIVTRNRDLNYASSIESVHYSQVPAACWTVGLVC